MIFSKPETLSSIAKLIDARYVGDKDFPVLGANEIHRVEPGDIVFANHPKYYDKALSSRASVILIDKEVGCPEGKALIISKDPFKDFNKINWFFYQRQNVESAKDPVVGRGSQIHPTAVLEKNVRVGENCRVGSNVVIGEGTLIGDHVVIQSGTVLGGDAFYYRKKKESFDRLCSVGNVVVEDYAEIGNLCSIDRGVTSSTIIGEGSVLDNQIQIGHDTVIGKRVLIASQVGIAGCCDIEDEVTIWGQVGIASGTRIEKGTVLLAKTGVMSDLKKDTYLGTVAQNYRDYLRGQIKIKKL
ncbi:MAG: UDP-3-O-(3-hydroxymyristoyl)glucosamine N-acyltransferase [Bergeyella sp.]|nr:UDP-3-O-(3-hydroxymyristoyl)glucosamine N-acyltransferase [Bergeyella sp.]